MCKTQIISAIFIAILSAQLSSAEHALLPDNLLSDWRGSEVEEYLTGEELYTYMNGGAELYLEYRFAGLTVREYSNPSGNSLSVEIYNFATPEDAYGIFSVDTTGLVFDVGQGGRQTKVAARFWKDRHYVRTFVWESNPELAGIPEAAARAVDQRIQKRGALPEWLDLLIHSNTMPVFIRGDIALQQVAGSWEPGELPIGRKGGTAWIPAQKNIPTCALVFNYVTDHHCSKSYRQIWDYVTIDAQSYATVGDRGIASRFDGSVDGLEKYGMNLIWAPNAEDEAACAESLDAIRNILSGKGGTGQ